MLKPILFFFSAIAFGTIVSILLVHYTDVTDEVADAGSAIMETFDAGTD